MAALRIILAGTPLGKQRVRFTQANQRPFTPEKTVNYEGRLAHAAQVVMDGRSLLTGPLRVGVEIRMRIPDSRPLRWRNQAREGSILPTKKPDADNVAKLLDALNLIVWADDAQIIELHVRKLYHDAPALIVEVDEILVGIFA
jgi:Holliday junction resolvase RusA-like endonuclease